MCQSTTWPGSLQSRMSSSVQGQEIALPWTSLWSQSQSFENSGVLGFPWVWIASRRSTLSGPIVLPRQLFYFEPSFPVLCLGLLDLKGSLNHTTHVHTLLLRLNAVAGLPESASTRSPQSSARAKPSDGPLARTTPPVAWWALPGTVFSPGPVTPRCGGPWSKAASLAVSASSWCPFSPLALGRAQCTFPNPTHRKRESGHWGPVLQVSLSGLHSLLFGGMGRGSIFKSPTP